MAELRRAEPRDLSDISGLYVAAFPARATQLVGHSGAVPFWADYFGLMRARHPESFFVAEAGGRFAGFALVTCPRTSAWRRGSTALARLALGAVFGRYGSPLRLLSRGLARASQRAAEPGPEDLAKLAHLDVIALVPEATGQGIARQLLDHAQEHLAARIPGLWLRVERDNPAAIRLYERLGMRDAGGDARERWMVWRWRERGSARTS